MSAVGKVKHLFYLGDVREKLAEIPEKSVHCVVTSPPYWGLRDYGLPPSVWGGDPECEHEWDGFVRDGQSGKKSKKVQIKGRDNFQIVPDSEQAVCQKCSAWLGCLGSEPIPELYIQNMVEIFREVRRVLRDDGTLWLNLGDSYASDTKGSGGGWANDPNNYAYKAQKYGARHLKHGLKPKDLVGIPWRVAFALQADGWYLRSDIIWAKPNPMPESVTDRPTKSHEYIFLLTKNQNYFFDNEAIKEEADPKYKARYNSTFYTGQKEQSGQGRPGNVSNTPGIKEWTGKRNKRTVWTISTQPYPEAHFATFPPKLIEPCILAGTSPRACEICGSPWERVVEKKRINRQTGKEVLGGWGDGDDPANQHKGGFNSIRPETHTKTLGWQPTCTCQNSGKGRCIVLDPFAGSGTTNLVAQTLGRDSIYIDRSKKYLNMALKRLGLQEQKLKRMLDTVQFQIFGAKEGDEQ